MEDEVSGYEPLTVNFDGVSVWSLRDSQDAESMQVRIFDRTDNLIEVGDGLTSILVAGVEIPALIEALNEVINISK